MNKQDKIVMLLEAIERHLDLANLLYSNKMLKILESIDAKLDNVSSKPKSTVTNKREYPYIFPGDSKIDFGGGEQ